MATSVANNEALATELGRLAELVRELPEVIGLGWSQCDATPRIQLQGSESLEQFGTPVVVEPIDDEHFHHSTACYGVQIVNVKSAELAR